MYEDKTLVCKECGAEFVFTAYEQDFYAEKGFTNEPTRCRACRIARKVSQLPSGAPISIYNVSVITRQAHRDSIYPQRQPSCIL